MVLLDLAFKRLDSESSTEGFNCGDDDLNDFLLHDALPYQSELLTVTYLFSDKEDKPLAFFSVSNDALKDQDFEKWNNISRKIPNRKRRKDYPAVKIARLGVDTSLHGKKLGTQIIHFIKNWFAHDNKTGCRFLLVDAYNKPETVGFYESNGFALLTEKDETKRTRLMYFDLTRMFASN